MASYLPNFILSPLATAKQWAASQASDLSTTAVTAAKANLSAQINSALQDEHGQQIANHIVFLHELLQDRAFSNATGATLSLKKEDATLEDFLDRLNFIIDNSKNLFGLDFENTRDTSIVKHKRPFIQLRNALQDELRDLAPASSKKLLPATQDAASAALGQLRELQRIRNGPLSTTALNLTSSPELASFILTLGTLQQALEAQELIKITQACDELSKASANLIRRKHHIFIGKDLDSSDESTLIKLQQLATAYSAIPDSLKYTRLLDPSEVVLMGEVTKAASSLQEYIKEQNGSLTNLITALKASAKNIIDQTLPTASSNNTINYSPLDKLHDAFTFFQGPGQGYFRQKQKNTLLTLLNACENTFKTNLLTKIASVNPANPENPDLDWAEDHLLDNAILFNKAFDDATKDYAQRHNITGATTADILTAARTQQPNPASNTPKTTPHKGTHALMDYVQAALKFMQGNGSFTECVIPAIGKTFTELLKSDAITAWIGKQPPANQTAFNDIRTTTLAALTTANDSASYTAALQQFQALFNAQHWILDGFELPTLLQDQATKTAQTQASQNLDETLSSLRKDLDKAKAKQDLDFDWNDATKAQIKLDAQLSEFSSNLKDQLTYQLIYETFIGNKTSNNATYYKIKTLQKTKPNADDKAKIFLKEMRLAINNSDAAWITKIFAKFLLPIAYSSIGYYSRNVIKNFYNNATKNLKQVDKANVLTRSSHCFSKYNAVLKHWASLPNGGDKLPTMNHLLKTKAYLEHEDLAYTQDELYKAVSNTLVNDHLHLLYAHNGQNTSLKSILDSTSVKLNRFILRRPLYSTNTFLSMINYLSIGCKALLIGVPLHTVIFASKLVVTPFGWLSQYFGRLIVKVCLNNYKVLSNTVQSTRQNVYEDNPYVHVITSFVADRLEALSKELEANPTVPATPNQANPVSEKTRSMIKKTLENLFELLDKDRFKTQEQLTKHLKDKGLIQGGKEQLDQLILPATIEALIDLTLTISDTVLTEQALRQPMSLLIDQLNELLTTPSTTQPSSLDKLKHKAAEEKLHKYADKILGQVIDQAVNTTFSDFGQQEAKQAESTLKWVKDSTPALLDAWNAVLQDISNKANDKDRYDALTDLVNKSDAFLVEMQNQRDLLNAKDSRTSKELAEKLLEIMTPFKELLRGGVGTSNGGLLGLYANYNHLYKDHEDIPFITLCTRCHETVQAGCADLPNNILDTTLQAAVQSNLKLLHTTLSDFAENKISLLKDLNHYTDVKNHISESFLKQRLTEANFLEYTAIPRMIKLASIAPPNNDFFHQLEQEKIAQITRYRKEGFFAFIFAFRRDYSDPWTTTYRDTCAKIKEIPDQKMQDSLLKSLQAIHSSKSNAAAKDHVTRFQNLWTDYMTQEKAKLTASIQRLENIDTPLYNKMTALAQEFKDDITSRKKDNNLIEPQLTPIIENIRKKLANLQNLQFVKADIGLVEPIRKYPTQIVYARLKPKMDGLVNLIRDGGFSQFFANHLLFMPLAKK